MIAAHKAVRSSILLHETLNWIVQGGAKRQPMRLLVDNSAVIRNYARGTSKTLGWLSLALRLRITLLRDLREAGILSLGYVPSKQNRADIFTKALERVAFESAREMLGCVQHNSASKGSAVGCLATQ
jgi:hypothetical protein